MRSEIVVGGENGKEATEPSVLMLQNMAVHHHQDPCSRSVIIHPPVHHQVVQQQMANDVIHNPPVSGMFAPPLPIQNNSNERREFREPELDIGSFFSSIHFILCFKLKEVFDRKNQTYFVFK